MRVWTVTLPTGLVNLWAWGDAVLVADTRRLWLIDTTNGDIRFTVNAADDERVDSQGDNRDGQPIQITGVALSPETAFVGLGTATIALDRAGGRRWRRPRPNPRNGVRSPEGAPIAASERWLVTHDPSEPVVHVGLRDASDGALQWLGRYDPPAASPPRNGPEGARSGPPDGSWYRSDGRITDKHIVIRQAQQVRW
ncbi:MAG: hypothetical protein IRY85_01980 [Micromonosporaceae bacterium]|nr:hypothetical protein [Micromonosporaceae bacterium]